MTRALKLVNRIICLSGLTIRRSDFKNETDYKTALGNKICDYHIKLHKKRIMNGKR